MIGATGGGPVVYYRKDKTGGFVGVEVDAKKAHQAPGNGYFKLRWTGVTAPFEMDGQYGKSRNVRCEFTVNMPGHFDHRKKFSQLFAIARYKDSGWQNAITGRSNMGQMVEAIRGNEIAPGETITLVDYLGGEIMGMVQQVIKTSENGTNLYANILKDTIKPVGQTAMPEFVAVAAAPTPQPSKPANPFTDDDDL